MTEVNSTTIVDGWQAYIRLFKQYLKQRRLFLIGLTILGLLLGTGYYFLQKPRYEGITTFILEEKSPGGGSLAGLATQFGLDLGGLSGGGSGIFSGDNILDILKSKKIVYKALLLPADQNKPDSSTLADLYLSISGKKKKWENRPDLVSLNFSNTGLTDGEIQLSALQDSVLNLVHEELVKKSIVVDRLNKKGSLIKVQVNSIDKDFSRILSERLVVEATNLYLEVKTGNSLKNIAYLQKRSDSLLMALNRRSFTAAEKLPLDLNPGVKSAIVPAEIANRDKAVAATLYAEITKNLEASKLILSQQTPVIEVLDRPGYLLDDNKKGLVLIVGAFGLLFAFLGFMWVLVRFILTEKLPV